MHLGLAAILQRKIAYASVWENDDTLTCLVAAEPDDNEINQVINDKALVNVFEAREWTRTAMVQAGPVMSLLMLNDNTDAFGRAERSGLLYRGGYLEIARRFGVRPFSQPNHPTNY